MNTFRREDPKLVLRLEMVEGLVLYATYGQFGGGIMNRLVLEKVHACLEVD